MHAPDSHVLHGTITPIDVDASATSLKAFEYIDIGSASVDQENSPLSGRVKGKYNDNYAALLDINYRFDL